jgi:hypothetical protein
LLGMSSSPRIGPDPMTEAKSPIFGSPRQECPHTTRAMGFSHCQLLTES